MTTKKQKREQTAAKRAAYDAETKRMGLEAQRRDHLRRERKKYEAEQAAKQRQNAEAMKALAPLVIAQYGINEPQDQESIQQGIDLSRDLIVDRLKETG